MLILASGDQTRVTDAVRAFFDAVGQRTVWLGPAGQGTRMKIALNAWLAALVEGLSETLAIAKALGVPSQRFVECIEGGPLSAPWAIAKLKKIEAGETADTEFPLRWATKDVHLAVDAVADRASLPALQAIARAWDQAVSEGLGDRDVSAAYLALQPQHY